MSYRILYNDHERVGNWVAKRLNGVYNRKYSKCIGLEYNTSIILKGTILAGVIYTNFVGNNTDSRKIDMHIVIEKSIILFAKEIFRYPFNQLKVNKIIATIDSTNIKCLEITDRLGFKQECIISDAGFTEDLVIKSLRKEDLTLRI